MKGLEGLTRVVGAVGGTGDVVGPAIAVNNRIAVYDGTTGKLIKDGGATIADIVAGGAAVTSVFGRTGAVIAVSGDYSFSQISGSVALSQIANINAPSFLGRNVGTGIPEELSIATAKSLLNLAGTNTGDVTLTGENYLSLVAQVLTANPVNLASSNVTGTLVVGKGGTGTAVTFTAGSVVFAGTSGIYTQDNSSFFWDDANNRLGIGTPTPSRPVEILNGSVAQLRLTHSGSNFVDFSTSSGGTLTVSPTGNINFDATGNQIDPTTNYDQNLGQSSKKYLSLHAAELWVETLVAQDTLATIGGRILVGPTTVLTSDLAPADTSIIVKHNQMTSGDRVYMEAGGLVEFMAITSAPSGSGPYTYTVTRNLDGTGANQWYAGDAVFNTGQTGNGFIDLYSIRGVKTSSQAGPTIVGNIRNSSTYNDWSEHWAIGNLNGLYGYGSSTPGVGLGQYAAGKAHITVDSTNGLRIFSGLSTVVGQWDASGNVIVGQVAASQSNIVMSSAGNFAIRTHTTDKIRLNSDGSGFLANSLIFWNTAGDLSVAGNAAIAGWSITSTKIASTGIDIRSGASAALSFGATPPTSASAGTGIWLDRTGLYALNAGTPTLTIAADGEFVKVSTVLSQLESILIQAKGTSGTTTGTSQLAAVSNNNGNSVFISAQATNTNNYTTIHSGLGTFLGMTIGSSAAPTASAVLDLVSTTGAFLPPRMTSTQRDALTPTDGMIIYNSTTGALNYRKAGAWVAI